MIPALAVLGKSTKNAAIPSTSEKMGLETVNNKTTTVSLPNNQIVRQFLQDNGIEYRPEIEREELLKAGYAFLNRIGSGERAIVQEIGQKSLRNAALLTEAELASHRREVTPKEVEQKIEEMGQDMRRFIVLAQDCVALNQVFGEKGFRRVLNNIKIVLSELGQFQIAEESGLLKLEAIRPVIEEVQGEAKERYRIPVELRGIPVDRILLRREGAGFLGKGCPVLDCDYVFELSAGIVIHDVDGKITGTPGQVRLNTVVAHLAEHGICNNGDADDSTQRYISLQEYMGLFDLRASDPDISESGMPDNPREVEFEVLISSLRRLYNSLGIELNEGEVSEFIRKEVLFLE